MLFCFFPALLCWCLELVWCSDCGRQCGRHRGHWVQREYLWRFCLELDLEQFSLLDLIITDTITQIIMGPTPSCSVMLFRLTCNPGVQTLTWPEVRGEVMNVILVWWNDNQNFKLGKPLTLNLLNICSIRGVTAAAGSIWASTQWKSYVQFCNNNIIYYIKQLILRKQITVCNFLHIRHVSCF